MASNRPRILIAGIGGASLGTEIIKCLKLAGRYTVFGCDISEFAYGLYQEGVAETFVLPRDGYVESLLELCKSLSISVAIPGGEEPLALLGRAASDFKNANIHIAGNSPEVMATCSDKERFFARLRELDIPTPRTFAVKHIGDFEAPEDFPYPCVIKPATGSGGSRFVFIASSRSEAAAYSRYLRSIGLVPLVQEYIPLDEGEFTIGVLSLPDKQLVGSVAMRRLLHAKLSVLAKTEYGIISSPYSQGLIDEFPDVRAQAENIARALNSVGPLDIQARIRNGVLIPFEVNPRFSGSTYLRAMAGFNQVDIYLRYLLDHTVVEPGPIKPGYYLRSLSELRVEKEEIKRCSIGLPNS